MYTSEILAERIKLMIKNKKTTVKQLLSSCGLNENTLNQMSDKKGLSSFSLAKIADYLDCSVDYLLGRTDNPKPEAEHTHIEQNHQFIQNDSSPIVFAMPSGIHLDENQQELLKRFGQLSYSEKIEFMQSLIRKTEKGNE